MSGGNEKATAKAGVGRIGRREVLKGALGAGIAAVTGTAEAQEAPAADAVTTADLAVAERLTGHHYTDADRALMTGRFAATRAALAGLRATDLGTTEPATHFEPCLPGMKLPREQKGFSPSSVHAPKFDGDVQELAFATTMELARLLRTRKVTSVALTRMYLERLKTYGPRLHCVVNLTEDLAIQQAEQADREIAAGHYRGSLHGVPWGGKDLLATKGIPTTFGAKPYEHQIFDYDATVVQRLEAAGAVLVAKLSMGELAMGDVWFGGLTRNPWRPAQGSSGSSAGPGSATAGGLVGFSIGTETLGSIVSPSVRNGVTGLRPTYGRISRYGAMALCWTMDKLGPICRGVEDCAAVLHAIYGPDGKDGTTADVPFGWHPRSDLKKLRVGIDKAAFDAVKRNAARSKVYADVLETLTKLGVTPVPITLPKENAAYGALAEVIINSESAAAFQKLTDSGQTAQLAQQNAGSWPNTFRLGSLIPAADYIAALRARTQLQVEMATVFQNIDCYVTVPFAGPSLVYTNLTGHPTIVTRCGLLDGAPQSIEFVGGLYRESAILRLAFAYEQATTWHRQWPDMSKVTDTATK
ncbi:MAG: Amidase [Chthonomonadaceae bacterium]|nr:Amidase [Chthonomonadaceae bacterium]